MPHHPAIDYHALHEAMGRWRHAVHTLTANLLRFRHEHAPMRKTLKRIAKRTAIFGVLEKRYSIVQDPRFLTDDEYAFDCAVYDLFFPPEERDACATMGCSDYRCALYRGEDPMDLCDDDDEPGVDHDHDAAYDADADEVTPPPSPLPVLPPAAMCTPPATPSATDEPEPYHLYAFTPKPRRQMDILCICSDNLTSPHPGLRFPPMYTNTFDRVTSNLTGTLRAYQRNLADRTSDLRARASRRGAQQTGQ